MVYFKTTEHFYDVWIIAEAYLMYCTVCLLAPGGSQFKWPPVGGKDSGTYLGNNIEQDEPTLQPPIKSRACALPLIQTWQQLLAVSLLWRILSFMLTHLIVWITPIWVIQISISKVKVMQSLIILHHMSGRTRQTPRSCACQLLFSFTLLMKVTLHYEIYKLQQPTLRVTTVQEGIYCLPIHTESEKLTVLSI